MYFTALDDDTQDEEALSVPRVMQWLTGQAHRHLLLSDRQAFKITVEFDHTCMQANAKPHTLLSYCQCMHPNHYISHCTSGQILMNLKKS